MKIRSIEKLQDLIDEDYIWRKKELIDLKLLIHSTNNPMLRRLGIALLCAHFEGFIKQSANYYIVYVSSLNINLSELTSGFPAIHSSKLLKQCAETDKLSVYQRFLDDFLLNYNSKKFQVRYVPDDPIIKTGGNPSSSVIKEIVTSIGLDFAPYEIKRNYIDSDLLRNRHSVVHGEKIQIPLEEFDETYKNIFDIMIMFKTQIVDAAIHKIYLKH